MHVQYYDERTRLLLVEDHPIVVEGLIQLLRHEPDIDVRWIAPSVEKAMEVCRNNVPDIAIVDLSLGRESGTELIKSMHALLPDLPILVMSMHEEALYADRVLRAGARGYINKQLAPRHVVAAIRHVRKGKIYRGNLPAAAPPGEPARTGPLSRLSDRELEVLQLISKGMRKAEIAKLLGRSVNTVETHRAGIKKKLRIRSATELARFAILHFHNP